ncbi:glycoside hydrolase family 2 TIM barrel-domain containing protein [Aquimarina sp. AU474]|uniref:glycoside hydrolase family 2 TIM barrel-domain containing protein n=1 Tax=Aquimarina sp. AU474 TaxID=2108529 RepID=UPI000D692697|nr:glycoside hydrolase family 2 TIM barrel-domain containing protein [Aquimarina sp. AU474]
MIGWNRNIYRSLIFLSFIGVIALMLFGIGQTLSYLNTGADRTSMLHLALKKDEVYLPKVKWEDTLNPGRPIEKQTLQDIEQDYLNSWYIRNTAYQTNTIEGIDDYYTKSARKNIIKLVQANSQKDIAVHSTTINHNIELDFYSADGQLVVLSDKNVQEYQRVYKGEKLLSESKIQSDYQILLMLEDGFWRIRHIVKEETYPLDTKEQGNTFAKVLNGKIYINDNEYQIKGINYYPQQTPWNMFGDEFDRNVIAKDFDIMNKAGLNTIRIFVPYEAFGKAKIDTAKLDKLKQVLDEAETKNLKVVVTLFDFYGDYSVIDWTLTHRHAEQIVSAFANHKAILAWDIKNEPNLDFESRGKENVLAWLKEMIQQVKQYDPNHLVTIGWSNTESVHLLQNEVDMISFHYYNDIDQFNADYLEVNFQNKKPIVLQEFGLPSSRGFWNPLGPSEKKQAAYHKQFQEVIKQNNLHYLSWTLYDFEEVPEGVVGKLPWRKHKQKHFGFIDRKGKKKAAFEFIAK